MVEVDDRVRLLRGGVSEGDGTVVDVGSDFVLVHLDGTRRSAARRVHATYQLQVLPRRDPPPTTKRPADDEAAAGDTDNDQQTKKQAVQAAQDDGSSEPRPSAPTSELLSPSASPSPQQFSPSSQGAATADTARPDARWKQAAPTAPIAGHASVAAQ